MNTAQDWHEMCVVKKKLDETMYKIDDMFIEVSDGCKFKTSYLSRPVCNNQDHEYYGSQYETECDLSVCPIVYAGIQEMEK
jgi:hypothetical protein